ncbi:hypothetical protein ABB37_05637 [Leptomonas pyrrhocoris]|uniref:Methyltransferase domain-containing protein n=1 Tax=Leptomonas pyrrhocoris TaxID=157538 RepID=A0A0M9FZ83_LEPPY|nr:hypothetical protein ABB37_05637 [Leptomonas pyrrhocoris]XP_015657564.1 hypothetical protein ABB37_05637 [Leptomonas pyrrhocoris]KPA79124.1 hypothetical protein ABB37_05637 [Leptomonas pyrrhocoris]KPA79125.1 hypothetical protein ABB37_05637 [Leptomonas pyrrhocoris]|eukprot:XP_015657563.1 hypothetical protein ABB37_05637 [Leptomonas pyrrhocoris]
MQMSHQTVTPPPASDDGSRSSSSNTATVEAPPPAKKPRAEAGPHTKHTPTPLSSPLTLSPDAMPTSNALLTARLKREIKKIWAAERSASASATSLTDTVRNSSGNIASLIPPFKVGTTEMYRRFPQAYDLLMHHHNCSALQTVLLRDIIGRIESAAARAVSTEENAQPQPPWIRVADFGCGTGRIEAMAAQHRAVQAIYAYDNEVAMLQQCLLNTVRSAARSQHYRGVSLSPAATTIPSPSSSSSAPLPSIEICAEDSGRCDTATTAKEGAVGRDTPAMLQLCVRPVPFQAIQDGFLAATHHPRCSLMVCAWSLSYVMRMQWGEDHWHAAVDAVVEAMIHRLDTRASDAAIVIVETLGNGSAEPTRQNTYTQRLEDHFGFTRTWVRTDYEFATKADAERMVRFFFGGKMLSRLTMDPDGVKWRLMECTGIWTLWKTRQQ